MCAPLLLFLFFPDTRGLVVPQSFEVPSRDGPLQAQRARVGVPMGSWIHSLYSLARLHALSTLFAVFPRKLLDLSLAAGPLARLRTTWKRV